MNYIQFLQTPSRPISRNWDNTLTGKLINVSENPDSVGYKVDEKLGPIWYAPDKSGYDKNQFGMGVDRNQTEGFSEKVKIDSNKKEYLTEEDERLLRHQKIEKANESANARYEYAKKATGRESGNISKIKDAAVVNAIYNLGATYVANTLFEDLDFMNLLFDGTDQQVVERINQEYKKKGRHQRVTNIMNYLNYT